MASTAWTNSLEPTGSMLPQPSPMRKSFREKVWGSTHLSPWYPDSDTKIGEVWFETDVELPLLVKFLFTSERLSVQVHPDDEYAARHENSRGKTEMWHVLRADPGASVAAGLRETISRDRLRELAISGEIEQFLNWIEVRPGDTIFIPAGTIHAIGPGLVLCEIQQHSDVTYRLYDYGRPRELHLDRSIDVSIPGPYEPPPVANCAYFAVETMTINASHTLQPKPDRFELLIAIDGEGRLDAQPIRAGDAWHIPAGAVPLEVEGNLRLLRTWVP